MNKKNIKKARIKPKRIIHLKLKKHIPNAVKKSKRIFSFKYLKIFFLILSIVLAYYLFSHPQISNVVSNLKKDNYIISFIAGILISFGFSAPFAIGYFITSNPQNIFLATILGGVGASLGDVLIFRTMKFSFMNEFEELKKTQAIRKIKEIVYNNKHLLIKHYFLYIFSGIIILTPLPDEVGVSMLAGLTTINQTKLALISFILHAIAIFFILYIGFIL